MQACPAGSNHSTHTSMHTFIRARARVCVYTCIRASLTHSHTHKLAHSTRLVSRPLPTTRRTAPLRPRLPRSVPFQHGRERKRGRPPPYHATLHYHTVLPSASKTRSLPGVRRRCVTDERASTSSAQAATRAATAPGRTPLSLGAPPGGVRISRPPLFFPLLSLSFSRARRITVCRDVHSYRWFVRRLSARPGVCAFVCVAYIPPLRARTHTWQPRSVLARKLF